MTIRSILNDNFPGACRRGAASASGFTLIELMITMLIVAILAAIAYPSYQSHVAKSRCSKAKSDLLELSHFLERNFTVAGTYAVDSDGNAVSLPFDESPMENDDGGGQTYYDLALLNLTRTSFTLQATPKNGQENYQVCGTLTLDQLGNKTDSVKGGW
jgi:type IV pilus assembly protein PilE